MCGANIRPIIFFKLNLGLAIVVTLALVVVIEGAKSLVKKPQL